MRTWIAVHLLHPTLDTLCPDWRNTAAVVIDHGQVRVCSPAARAAGVQPGMRISGVNTLCPQAVLTEYDEHIHHSAIQAASLALLQYTPELALGERDTLLLDVTASLSLFGGIQRLYRRIQGSLHGLCLSASCAIGTTAGGAWLLATCACARLRRCLKPGTQIRRLDALPVGSLPAAHPYEAWLGSIGCTTLGAMRQLPRAGLQRRTSRQVLQVLDAAYGNAPEIFKWVVAPLQFQGRIELVERIEYAEAVSRVAGRLIEQLCGWLAGHQRAVTQLVLLLEHERGRHAREPSRVELATAAPTREPAHLMRLLQEHLHHLKLVAPIIAVTLEAARVQETTPVADDLFPERGGTPQDRQRVLEIILARLGHDRVLAPAPIADHRPEVANRWGPANTAGVAGPVVEGVVRPCWLLEKPLLLSVRKHRPWYGSPLHILQGPERIEDGWWEGWALRDYFVAQDNTGVRYWLFRERYGQWRWFLHGVFG
ncbi:protein ImuB [Advenella incenata]|uniref:Protein ImuB n=1 Tax=Advenella incenata TaxID=267800 RepID=A0A4Q7VSV2_9BURK|nr:DNA polymerase Y family protein [Advenella incenata]RZT99569.1 protein ImuB [Advenella incenata]